MPMKKFLTTLALMLTLVIPSSFGQGIVNLPVAVTEGEILQFNNREIETPVISMKFFGEELEDIGNLVSAFYTVNNNGQYIPTDCNISEGEIKIDLPLGACYLFIQIKNNYMLSYIGNTASNNTILKPVLLESFNIDTYSRLYGGGRTVNIGDYFLSINTDSETYQNDVTLNFNVSITPPTVSFSLIKDETVTTNYLYHTIKVINADGTAVNWGIDNNKTFYLPVNLKIIPNQTTDQYIISNLEITTSKGEAVSLTELSSEYKSTVIEEPYEGGGFQYILDLTKDAGDLDFAFTISDTTPNSVNLRFIGKGNTPMQNNIDLKIDGETFIPNNFDMTLKIAEKGTTLQISPKEGYVIDSLEITDRNGQSVAEETFEENGWASITQNYGSYEIKFVENKDYTNYRFTFNITKAETSEKEKNIYFIFEGGENAYKAISLINYYTLEPVELTSNLYEITVDGGVAYNLVGINGAIITSIVTPDGEEVTPTEGNGWVNTDTYAVQVVGMAGSWAIAVESGIKDGSTFIINLTNIYEGNPPVYISGGIEGTSVANSTLNYGLNQEGETNVWTTTVTIQPNNEFRFFTYIDNGRRPDNGAPEVGSLPQNWIGPKGGNDVKVVFEKTGDTAETEVIEGTTNSWILSTDNPWKIEMIVDMNNKDVHFVAIEEVVQSLDGPSSRIGFIEADSSGLYKVYNLTGYNVINTYDESELQHLAKGIYIVNGKKVIIR